MNIVNIFIPITTRKSEKKFSSCKFAFYLLTAVVITKIYYFQNIKIFKLKFK